MDYIASGRYDERPDRLGAGLVLGIGIAVTALLRLTTPAISEQEVTLSAPVDRRGVCSGGERR